MLLRGEQGSILCPAFKREIWESATGELLHLCHEAADRRSEKTGALRPPFSWTHCRVKLNCWLCVNIVDVLQDLSTEFSTKTQKQSA